MRWLLVAALSIVCGVYAAARFLSDDTSKSPHARLDGCSGAICCFMQIEPVHRLNLGFASSLTKIYREPPFCQRGDIREIGRLSLAANEYESIQLVLLAGEPIEDVSVNVLPLRHDNPSLNAVAPQVEVRTVAHVSQTRPKVEGSRVGWQPDPLLPGQPVDLQQGLPQAFLITVYALSDTPPGVYAVDVEIRQGQKVLARRNLAVEVWDFALPAKSPFKTAAFTSYAMADQLWPVEQGFPLASADMRMSRFLELAELGFKNRLPPLGFIANGLVSEDKLGASRTRIGFPLYVEENGQPVFNRQQADNLIDYLHAHNVNHFFIGFTADIYKEPDIAAARQATLLRYLRDYHAYLKEKNLLNEAYIYNIDEPWGESVEHARSIYKLIKAHFGDELRVMQNTNQNNGRIVGELLGDFDVLDINLGFFGVNEIDAYRRRYPGAMTEMWWNLNLWPDSRPNLFLEYPLIDARILGPMSYRHQIQGFEYWDLAAPYSADNYFPLSGKDLTIDWRVGENTLDGLLVYPNTRYGFYSSLRLESFRDGMEDQDYLYLLEQLDAAHPLLGVPIVRAIDDYETDIDAYLDYRRRLAQAIVQRQAQVVSRH